MEPPYWCTSVFHNMVARKYFKYLKLTLFIYPLIICTGQTNIYRTYFLLQNSQMAKNYKITKNGENLEENNFISSTIEKKGNCEEELPKKPVGRLSAVCRSTVGRQLAVCRPTVGRQSTNSRPTVGRQTANCRPTVGQQF